MDIGSWLRRLGLERYEQAFRENEIDLRVLPELTADDLKELGVAAIGHRRLLLKAITDDVRAFLPYARAKKLPRAFLFLNTERGFGGKPPKRSGFRRHLAGSKMPKDGVKNA